jgi:hypothetical protein
MHSHIRGGKGRQYYCVLESLVGTKGACPLTGNPRQKSRGVRTQIPRVENGCAGQPLVESECGAVVLGWTDLLPPLSSGGALVVQPCLRFHIPLIEPGLVDLPHPALGQDLTPSPTTRRAQAGTGVRARSVRKGAGVDKSRPCVA